MSLSSDRSSCLSGQRSGLHVWAIAQPVGVFLEVFFNFSAGLCLFSPWLVPGALLGRQSVWGKHQATIRVKGQTQEQALPPIIMLNLFLRGVSLINPLQIHRFHSWELTIKVLFHQLCLQDVRAGTPINPPQALHFSQRKSCRPRPRLCPQGWYLDSQGIKTYSFHILP